MPQFLTGNGRQVAPARATPIATGEPIGADSGQAMMNFGGAVTDFAVTQANIDSRERHRQEQIAEMARRQQDLVTLQQGKDALRDAHDEIANSVSNGTLDKGAAEQTWLERAKALTGESTTKLRSQHQDIARRELEGLTMQLGNSVRRVVEKRNQSDIAAGIDQTLEYQARQYATDPTKATQQALATLEQLGPFAGLTPEQIQRKGQAWREGTQYTQGYAAVSAGRNDRKALDAAEKLVSELPDLDPQKRATLLDRAQAYRLHQDQQAELQAARRQREADAHLKRAEAAYTTFQTLADKGGVLDPTYIDQVSRATAGTPYQAGVVALAKQAVETGGFAAQPLDVQRATLQALDAKIATEGRNPALDKHRTRLANVLAASEKAAAGDDALNEAVERGVITGVQPLNLAGGVAGIAQQLSARSQQASIVETWAKRPVSPFTKAEADTVSGLLKSMPTDQRATALQTLAGTMTPRQAQALAAQLDGNDKALGLALAAGSAQTTFDRPVSELILRGAEAIKSKAVKLEDAAETGLTAQFDKELGGAITNPEQAQRVREAAKFIWAGKAAEGQRIDPANAVRLALGGQVVEHNGAKIVLPAGIDESALRQRLSAYPADALAAQLPDGKVYVRGQPVDAAQFLASLPGAQLRTLARGKFAVQSGGAVATNAKMAPIVLEVR